MIRRQKFPVSHAIATSIISQSLRQWPGTFCSSHECPLVHTHGFRMTIHGLWPNYNDGTWPSFCDPQYKFDDDAVADLIPDLKEAWPTEFDSNEGNRQFKSSLFPPKIITISLQQHSGSTNGKSTAPAPSLSSPLKRGTSKQP